MANERRTRSAVPSQSAAPGRTWSSSPTNGSSSASTPSARQSSARISVDRRGRFPCRPRRLRSSSLICVASASSARRSCSRSDASASDPAARASSSSRRSARPACIDANPSASVTGVRPTCATSASKASRSCRRVGSAASSCAVSASIAARRSPPAPAIWIDSSVRCWSSPTADSVLRSIADVNRSISTSAAETSASSRDRSRSSNHVGRARSIAVRSASWAMTTACASRVSARGSNRRNWSRARSTASCAAVRFSKCSMRSSTRRSTSKGSSMWDRTKPLRSSTAFMDTVWWNRSSAWSDGIPNRRRNALAKGGNDSSTCAPRTLSALRRSPSVAPVDASKSDVIDRSPSATT